MVPPTNGETIQLITTVTRLCHLTASGPMATTAKPTMAPTMEWVVETGQPLAEAIISQMAEASRAASMP